MERLREPGQALRAAQKVTTLLYDVQVHKSYLRQVELIPVKITGDSIRPLRKCSGVCQNDSGCCGSFEGLGMDEDTPCARCSRGDALA